MEGSSGEERAYLKFYMPARMKMAIKLAAVKDGVDASHWLEKIVAPHIELE